MHKSRNKKIDSHYIESQKETRSLPENQNVTKVHVSRVQLNLRQFFNPQRKLAIEATGQEIKEANSRVKEI